MDKDGGKAILRKPRLKLDSSKSFVGAEGSFSAGFAAAAPKPVVKGAANRGTVECGVCGAVRFYKFIKQAKKFGIFCCESCRKFIAKMVVRMQENSPVLQCYLGEGTFDAMATLLSDGRFCTYQVNTLLRIKAVDSLYSYTAFIHIL